MCICKIEKPKLVSLTIFKGGYTNLKFIDTARNVMNIRFLPKLSQL